MITSHELKTAIAIALLATQSAAQVTGTSLAVGSTATQSASTPARTWVVDVGRADHVFRPDTIQASIGDIVQFQFFPANHSVVRAAYEYPCIPYELSKPRTVGFFSGFHAVDAILDKPPTFDIRINDTDPIFFYCSAAGSCINYQMVGVINPNASVSLATQKKNAGKSKYMLQPGDAFPAEGGVLTGNDTAATVKATNPLPGGAIAGIVVGAIVILLLGAALAYFLGRANKHKKERNRASLAAKRYRPPPMAAVRAPAAVSLPVSPSVDPYADGGTVYIPIKATDFAEYNRRSGGTDDEIRSARSVAVDDADELASQRYSGADAPWNSGSGSQANLYAPERALEERQVWPPVRLSRRTFQ